MKIINTICWLIVVNLIISGCNAANIRNNQCVKSSSSDSSLNTTAKTFDKKNARFSMDVFLNKDGVKILSVYPYSDMNQGLKSVPANTPDSLRWIIKADNGSILTQGFVPDPRIVIVEPGPNGEHGSVYREETAMFQLDVPTNQGMLELYENNPSSSSRNP